MKKRKFGMACLNITRGGSASISCSYNNQNGIATIKLNNSSNGKAEAGGSDSESKSTNVHAWLIIKK